MSYDEIIEKENKKHKDLENWLNYHLTRIHNLKNKNSNDYFEYYNTMCNVFERDGHELCHICGDLQDQGFRALAFIKRTYCNDEK
jgi:ERCC4-type nuclease